jgi:hypothetical protein
MKAAYTWLQTLGGVLMIAGAIALLGGAVVLIPAFTLWSLNTLAEQGRFGWYIPHNAWTYIAMYGVLLALGCLRVRA